MGLQLENLLLGSFDVLRTYLGLDGVPVLNVGPYAQRATRRRRGCQIDIMVTTKHAVYLLEVQLRRSIDLSVIDDVKTKIDRLGLPVRTPVRTALVYEGQLQRGLRESDFLDHLIPISDLLDG